MGRELLFPGNAVVNGMVGFSHHGVQKRQILLNFSVETFGKTMNGTMGKYCPVAYIKQLHTSKSFICRLKSENHLNLYEIINPGVRQSIKN